MTEALIVNGMWWSGRTECRIINIYAPCLVSEKLELWDRIFLIINQYQSSCICIIDDFNSIRNGLERDGRGMQPNTRDMMVFNSFINMSGLNDLPLHGRRFTWYKTDGSYKSRIDRVLLNNHWMSRWPNVYQKGLWRTVSSDWGPKPFRCLNTWFSHPDFGNFVRDKLRSYNIEGWGGFIIKKKLKLLKNVMKELNSHIFGNLGAAIKSHKQEIQ
ncbi:hypothetical protein ACS0TY_031188 [Phlomoides rotata]